MRKRIISAEEHLKKRLAVTNMQKINLAREYLRGIPRGISLEQLKLAYIDHVLEVNDQNRSAAAREMDLPYQTLIGFLRGEHDYTFKPAKKGRPRKGV